MPEAEVLIQYGALPYKGGWIPVLKRCKEWGWLRVVPVDRDKAIAEAKASAHSDAERYVGDWNVTILEVTL